MTTERINRSGWEMSLEHASGVLLRPNATWSSLAVRPTFGLVLVVSVVLGALTASLQAAKVDPEEALQVAIQNNPAAEGAVSSEAIAAWIRWSSLFGALIFGPAWILLVAAIFLGWVRAVGGQIDYRRSLAVTVHGFLPFAFGSILTLLILPFYEIVPARALNEALLVPTHLGVLVPEDWPGWLRALAGSADLLSLWSLFLLTQGFSIVGRISLRSAWLGIGSIWVIGIAVKIGLAWLGAGPAG